MLKARSRSEPEANGMALTIPTDVGPGPERVGSKALGVAMKEWAVDESLSEETRESAKDALDTLVAAQIQRDAALEELKSEAQFKRMMQEAERLDPEFDSRRTATSEEMMDWLERHRLQHYAARVTRVAGGYVHYRRTSTIYRACIAAELRLCSVAETWSRVTWSISQMRTSRSLAAR